MDLFTKDYNTELEFSETLSNWLDGKTLRTQIRLVEKKLFHEDETKIYSTHQGRHNNGRPDIKIELETPLKLAWRDLSNPFYVECKTNPYLIKTNINQFYRYKYERGSKKHKNLDKFGDYNVVATCPQYLNPKPGQWWGKEGKHEWGNGVYSTEHWCWQLGIGSLLNIGGEIRITFNVQEQLVIV